MNESVPGGPGAVVELPGPVGFALGTEKLKEYAG